MMNVFYQVLGLILIFFLSNGFSSTVGDRVQLNGYSSFEFEKQIGKNGKGDEHGSFDMDLFDIVLNVRATDRLRVVADITWEHGTATEDGIGNAAIEYAFPEYIIADWLRLRAGKMLLPFGIYNEIHTAKPLTFSVKEPQSTNKNHKFGSKGKGGRFYPRWLNGFSVLGNGDIGTIVMDYHLNISNGFQENTNPYEEDDNPSKAVTGRVRADVLDGLKIGTSVYWDANNILDTAGNSVEDSLGALKMLSLGGQLEWELFDGLGLELEYVYGTVDLTGSQQITRQASTAMFSYRIQERYTPYLRFEYLDPDFEVQNDLALLWVYGVNVQVDHGLYLKLELNTVSAQGGNSRFGGGKEHFSEFKSSISIGF